MKKALVILLVVFLIITAFGQPASKFSNGEKRDPFGWNNIEETARPATFWWWLGSSVNENEIERQLKMLKEAGFGGVMVCPLYEYKDPAIPPVEYLSDRWIQLFKFTLAKASELGMLVDMTTGGGWPMGGPWIKKENGERDWRLEVLNVKVTDDRPVILQNEEGRDPIQCVTIIRYSPETLNVRISDTTGPATILVPGIEEGKPIWVIKKNGSYKILVVRMSYSGSTVYVAGKGGIGPVFDYWSPEAFDNLIQPFDRLFKELGDLRPRAVFCDSFEGQGGTTPGFFESFEKVNGYDVRPYMHQYLSENGTPENVRLWHDYRATMAYLHVEFVKRWRKWANMNGMLTRYQYTGDPANPLNTLSEADIPEDPPPFNTSAAHISGKKLISNEEFTWGAGHNFKDYLDYYRKRGDDDLMQGLNHKIYHGTPFTPLDEPWPGPMYYAGGNFSETQPFFTHIRYLNDYFARLQQTLQDSEPDGDVLMLWSIHDFWNMPNVGGFNWGQPFVWRNSNSALWRKDIKSETRSELIKRGIQTDFCSDEILTGNTTVENGLIRAGVSRYKVLVVPETKMVSNGTLKKICQLANEGATVIFINKIPISAPVGLPLVQNMTQSTINLEKMLKANTNMSDKGGVYIVSDTLELLTLLSRLGINEEGVLGTLSTLRVNRAGQPAYFIRNNTGEYLDIWVPLSGFDKNCGEIIAGNPRTGSLASVEHYFSDRGTMLVRLVFEPTELLAVTTIGRNYSYLTVNPFDYRRKDHIETVGGRWKISWSDYNGILHQISGDTLKSWTEWPELGLFSGIVSYKTSFFIYPGEKNKQWEIDVGEIHESAEVFVNGEKAGCVWTTPFRLNISGYLKNGSNILELRVANKSQNRIIDMTRRGILWQKSKLEEVSDDRATSGPLRIELLKPVISGLLGPVVLLSAD